MRDVTQVTWEDLEDIGIVKLGHQKKILLAIKRVKDIISGKWNPGGANAYQQQVRSGWKYKGFRKKQQGFFKFYITANFNLKYLLYFFFKVFI